MKLAVAPLLLGSAAASSAIHANSRVGKNLLNRARRLDGGNGEMTWAVNYSLKFEKCAATTDYYSYGNQDNQNQNNANGLYEQRLVHFKLCPTDSCSSGCKEGADYVIDMNEFVQSYLEHQQEAQEQECERVANNCYCENANDDEVRTCVDWPKHQLVSLDRQLTLLCCLSRTSITTRQRAGV